jgi:hypothetical protein
MLARMRFDARRIMFAGIACQQCGKHLPLSTDLSNAEAREELRDEGWTETPGGWRCNECGE